MFDVLKGAEILLSCERRAQFKDTFGYFGKERGEGLEGLLVERKDGLEVVAGLGVLENSVEGIISMHFSNILDDGRVVLEGVHEDEGVLPIMDHCLYLVSDEGVLRIVFNLRHLKCFNASILKDISSFLLCF